MGEQARGCGLAEGLPAFPGGRTAGTGEPVAGRSFSEAVWMGVEALERVIAEVEK